MTFLRRMLVVLAVLVAIVGIGFAWRASPLASLVSNDRREFTDGAGSAPTGTLERRDHERGGAGDPTDLAGTLVIEGAIVGAIVVIDKRRRAQRPRLPAAA